MNFDLPYRERLKKIIRRYDPDPRHSRHVAFLALRLFDELTSLHGLSAHEREILEVAALLHDIGMFRGKEDHHKHSRDFILSLNIQGFSREDIRLCAQVARYHRKAHPDPLRHRGLQETTVQFRETLDWLAGMLRIADGLDRGRRSIVRDVRCRIMADRVVIELIADRPCGLEHCGGARKSVLLRKKIGLPLECTVV